MLCLECTTLPRGKANWRQYFKDTADSAAKYDCRFSRPTLDCFILSTVSKTVWPDSDARPWFLPMIYKLLRYNRLVKDSAPQIAWPSKQASAYASVSFFFVQLWSGNVDSKRSVSKASASAVDDSYTRSLPELSLSLSSSGSQDIPRWVFLQQKCYAGDCNLLSKETFLWGY